LGRIFEVIELLQMKFSPFVTSVILVQKELKLLTLRMKIGVGGLAGIDIGLV